MIKNNYYQINDEEKTIEFEPFTRKTNKYPFSYNTLRNTMIISLTIGIGLLMYTATITSPINTINLNTYTKYSLLDNDTISVLFDEFKTTYNKSYETDYEQTIRYDNFRKFLYMVDERNNNDSYAIHGITKFADLKGYTYDPNYVDPEVNLGLFADRIISLDKQWLPLSSSEIEEVCNKIFYFNTNEKRQLANLVKQKYKKSIVTIIQDWFYFSVLGTNIKERAVNSLIAAGIN
jgi:hypothetical protein